MVFYLRFLILAFLTLTLNANAQIAAWDLDGNTGNETSVNATTTAANVAIATLSRDPGLVPEVLANSFGSSSFVSTTGGPGLAEANAQDKIIRVRMEIECGYQASFSTLDVNFLRDADGPFRFRWFFSLSGGMGGGVIGGFNFTYNGTEVNGLAQTQIDLSGIPALQNVPAGTVINFTLRALEATTDAGLFGIGRLTGDDLSIGGTITPLITTWNGTAWSNGDPDVNRDVIVNDDFTVTSGSDFGACTLTVNAGATLTVNDGALAEVQNETVIAGNLVVESQGNFVQNDNTTGTFTLSGAGMAILNKITPIKANWFFYNYWGSPVVGETIGNVFPDVDANRRFFFNASNYEDADGDSIDDDGNDWQFALEGDAMTPGVGYAATADRRLSYPTAITVSFQGQFNSRTVSTPIVFNPANDNESWNLIGNPYPGAVDANAFISANSAVIEGSLYYWSHASPAEATNPGNEASNFNQGDYAVFTSGMGGTVGGGGVQPTRFIPSGQGFFVSGLANGSAIFTNAMRSVSPATNNSQFFKTSASASKAKVNDANKLWLNLTTPGGVLSQILIGYVDGATANDDGLSFDAPRVSSVSASATLYSSINNSTRSYAIQGKNTADLSTNEVVRIGFNTVLNNTVNYTLSIDHFEGRFFSTNPVFVKDNRLDILHNLSNQDYTFTSESGDFKDRFQIVFNENTFSTTDLNTPSAVTIIQTGDSNFKFSTTTSNLKSITIYDLLGKAVERHNVNTSTLNTQFNTLSESIYIAKIELENGYICSKKIILK
jgi:hypothetical protein